MAEPSDNTKKTANSMLSRVGKSALGGAKKVVSSVGKLFTKKPENVIPHPSGPTETLGEIFKMMKIMDEDRRANQEMANAHIEEQKHEKDRRNDEIIKALTARKKPKPKKEKKVEEKKPEEKKPEEKKPEEKKAPEKKPPEKKVEEKKVEEKKPKETAEKVKEEKKTKETADKAKKEEEAKKAKETADKLKKEEAKKAEEASKTTAKKEEKPTEVIPQAAKKIPPIIGTDSNIKKMIMQHEGKINFPYKDSKGLWTIGVGHLIGDGKTLPPEYAAYKDNGGPNDKKNNRTPAMTDAQVMDLFEKDFEHHKQIAMRTPNWNLANENGQTAMIDLAYNMGEWWNTKTWKNSKAVKGLKEGDFKAFADNMEDSLWYKQVGNRAVKVVDMIRNGKKTEAELVKTIPSSTTGTTLDESSKSNADMKKDMNSQQSQAQQNVNVVNQNINQPEQGTPTKPNDTNPLLAKVKGQPK